MLDYLSQRTKFETNREEKISGVIVKLIVSIVANCHGGGLEQVARVAAAHVIGRVSATLLRLHHGS